MSSVPLFAGIAMVAMTAYVATRRLAPPTTTDVVLGAYLVGFAEIVAIVLALSVVRSLYAWTVLACLAVVLVVTLGASFRTTSHRSPLSGLRTLRAASRDPVVAVLAIGVVIGLGYSAVLGLLTPSNDWDAMTYHLARAAFWIQQHAVAYVPNSPFAPINAYPPNAEIGALLTLILSGGDRYVGAVQFVALLATASGTYGIGRRIGLDAPAALFGALAFLTLPVVLLQSWTALNDIVVASFLVAATYFLLGTTRVDLGLAGVALALAVGTKFTALIALPLVALVALVGQSRHRWLTIAVTTAAGAAIGSVWLVVNLVHTGSIDAGAADALGQDPARSPQAILARATRMLVRFADSQRLGRDVILYLVVGAALFVVATVIDRPKARRLPFVALGLAVVAALPAAMPTIGEALLRAHEKLWVTLGSRDLAFLDKNRDPHSPSTVFSYYGSLGIVLIVTGIVLSVLAVRRGVVRREALVLAAAPLAFALLLATAAAYDPFRGRFFMFPVALAAATWGLVLPHRWLAWGATAIAVVTVPLVFVHSTEKPAGIALLERGTTRGVWGKSREQVQTWTRGGGTARTIEFFKNIPHESRVGLRVGEDDWVYPYFGRHLERRVVFAPPRVPLDGLDWLVVAPGHAAPAASSWSTALETADGWHVYRRIAAS